MRVGGENPGKNFGISGINLCFLVKNGDFGGGIGHLVEMGIGVKNGVKCLSYKDLRW
jgi:hypothetical protein